MVILNENELLPKLKELSEIEVKELQKYSATPSCGEAKEGMEAEYNYHKNKVRIITEVIDYIFFSAIFPPNREI